MIYTEYNPVCLDSSREEDGRCPSCSSEQFLGNSLEVLQYPISDDDLVDTKCCLMFPLRQKKKVRESVQFAFFFDSRICLLPWILLSFEFICWLKKKKKSSLTRDMSSSGHILGNKDRFRNDAILEFCAFFLFVRYTFRREIVSRDSFLLLDLRHQWLLSVDDDEGMNMQRSVIVIHESLIIIIVSLKDCPGMIVCYLRRVLSFSGSLECRIDLCMTWVSTPKVCCGYHTMSVCLAYFYWWAGKCLFPIMPCPVSLCMYFHLWWSWRQCLSHSRISITQLFVRKEVLPHESKPSPSSRTFSSHSCCFVYVLPWLDLSLIWWSSRPDWVKYNSDSLIVIIIRGLFACLSLDVESLMLSQGVVLYLSLQCIPCMLSLSSSFADSVAFEPWFFLMSR